MIKIRLILALLLVSMGVSAQNWQNFNAFGAKVKDSSGVKIYGLQSNTVPVNYLRFYSREQADNGFAKLNPSVPQNGIIWLGEVNFTKYTGSGIEYQNNPNTGILFGNNSLDIKQNSVDFYTGSSRDINAFRVSTSGIILPITPASESNNTQILVRNPITGVVGASSLDASFVQLNPSSQQSGGINIGGGIQSFGLTTRNSLTFDNNTSGGTAQSILYRHSAGFDVFGYSATDRALTWSRPFSVTSAPTQPNNVLRLSDVATGKTIGANAGSATLWGTAQADFTQFGTNPIAIIGYDNTLGKATFFSPSMSKSFLGTTLQDVLASNNTATLGANFGGASTFTSSTATDFSQSIIVANGGGTGATYSNSGVSRAGSYSLQWNQVQTFIVDNGLTTAQTSSTLNSAYAGVPIGYVVIAPNVGTGMEYRKVSSTTWRAVSSTSI